ncbi:hypothetical protein [Methylobacterium durans]|uniref:Uncharacterized protein n=1 Tax=Methylobacterium durans TaxID=2202825 RepID=A0A2U8WCV0_9HYPH|nr:hypothetical protein [Methylobacterium durans]AWN44004.1 hypothetical protein DK389_30250 [Methylobacterium durans]
MEDITQLKLKTSADYSGGLQFGLTISKPPPVLGARSQSLNLYVRSLSEIIRDRSAQGWSVSLLTIMPDRIRRDLRSIPPLLHEPVCRIYAKLASRVVRRPRSLSGRDFLPVLIGCADLPIYKLRREGTAPSCLDVDGGLHLHALLAIPPASRLKGETVEEHFAQNDELYRRGGGIGAIDVRPVCPADIEKVTRYAFKAVRDGKIDLDAGVLILPRTVTELPQ